MKKILLLCVLFSCMSVFAVEIFDTNNNKNRIDVGGQINRESYLGNLEYNIKHNWAPPKSKSTKKIVTRFTILKDGTLSDIKVIKSSRVPLIDLSAIEAIKKSSPYQPLPEKFEGESLPIEFTFDYNILTTPHDSDTCKTKFCKFIQEHQ